MTSRGEKVLAEAMQLPVEERSQVIASLLDSLDAQDTDDDVETRWTEEVRRRRDDVQSGKASLMTWEDVRAELLEDDSKPC